MCQLSRLLLVVQLSSFCYLYRYVGQLESRLDSLRATSCDNVAQKLPYVAQQTIDVLQEDTEASTEVENLSLENDFSKTDGGNFDVENVSENQRKARDALSQVENMVVDNQILVRNSSSGDTENNATSDSWVWINEYSRLPLKAMQGFCSSTREYCPAGAPGPKGDTVRGPKGPKGAKGDKGSAGLDGRDGIPGEPGLDSICIDGKPGTDGRDGIPGIDGMPGISGVDGTPGMKGDIGTPGPAGPPGLPGPKGVRGRDGTPGSPGSPGIQLWSSNVNGSAELLQPPSIIGNDLSHLSGSIVVREMENVRLKCFATGFPEPKIVWRKIGPDHHHLIHQGLWAEVAVMDNVLQIANVSRRHSGQYMCVASNGLPPSANYTLHLHVHFSPMIMVARPIVFSGLGRPAELECVVEAYPLGVYYWTTSQGDVLDQNTDKYSTEFYYRGIYTTVMQLNISNIEKKDLDAYYCIAKNEEGFTRAVVNVTDKETFEVVPVTVIPVVAPTVIYGKKPPQDSGALCPECPKCRICGFGYRDLDIGRLHHPDVPLPPPKRNIDCEMETIGKPVYHHSVNVSSGSWMRDAEPRTSASSEQIYVTFLNDSSHLYEFTNKATFLSNTPTHRHLLPVPFIGNDHAVYNGSFYYATGRRGVALVRYDLTTKNYTVVNLPSGEMSSTDSLYKSSSTKADVSVDDYGVWVIYALEGTPNTAVLLANAATMEIEYAWNVSVKHRDSGDMFVLCGVLYAIDSLTEFNTKISLALDLFKRRLLDDISIPFTNPFKNTTMVTYNFKYKELYTWDAGNMLTYPIRVRFLAPSNDSNNVLEYGQNVTIIEKT